MAIVSGSEWECFTSQYPNSHLLQSAAWGDFKAQFGWQVERLVVDNLGAQILFRTKFPGIRVAYIPKGPIGLTSTSQISWVKFLQEVDQICRQRRAFLLIIEPDAWANWQPDPQNPQGNFFVEPILNLVPAGVKQGLHYIQPIQTILVDLDAHENQILNRMKQKTRYNIRLAQRSEVIISSSEDTGLFYEMMKETGERDRFGVHHPKYYQICYGLFHPRGQCELLLASFQGEPLAMLMVFGLDQRAWYLYGASRSLHREKMPTYLLQWEAMRWAKARGCKTYDLWGVPDKDFETLETKFASSSTGLWGVYRFKRGFGGTLIRSAGPWERIYNPFIYRLYQFWLKKSEPGEAQ